MSQSAARTDLACLSGAFAGLAIADAMLASLDRRHAEHKRQIEAASQRIDAYLASLDARPVNWIVTSQTRKEWPSKDYLFHNEGEARAFLKMCQRDGDYCSEIRRAA